MCLCASAATEQAILDVRCVRDEDFGSCGVDHVHFWSRHGRTFRRQRGLLGKIFSVKGALLLLPLGYLYVSHRGLLASLAGIAVKYPALLSVWILKTLWRLVLKPTSGFLLHLSRCARPHLPGGSH